MDADQAILRQCVTSFFVAAKRLVCNQEVAGSIPVVSTQDIRAGQAEIERLDSSMFSGHGGHETSMTRKIALSTDALLNNARDFRSAVKVSVPSQPSGRTIQCEFRVGRPNPLVLFSLSQ
jgi:hypothetical protein